MKLYMSVYTYIYISISRYEDSVTLPVVGLEQCPGNALPQIVFLVWFCSEFLNTTPKPSYMGIPIISALSLHSICLWSSGVLILESPTQAALE